MTQLERDRTITNIQMAYWGLDNELSETVTLTKEMNGVYSFQSQGIGTYGMQVWFEDAGDDFESHVVEIKAK